MYASFTMVSASLLKLAFYLFCVVVNLQKLPA